MADTFGGRDATARVTYNENVKLALQANETGFTNCFTYINNLKGIDIQAVELVASTKASRNVPTNAPTPNVDMAHLGIHVAPQRVSWGTVIPRETDITHAIDYTSTYVQSGSKACVRERDLILYEALFGPRLISKVGPLSAGNLPVATAWAGQTVAINETGTGATGGNTGLVVGKLLKGIELLINANVDVVNEEIFVGTAGQDNTVMMLQTQLASRDYRSMNGAFDKKVLDAALGLRFVPYPAQLTKVGASTYRELPMWVKSGMHWGAAKDFVTEMDKDPAYQYQYHPMIEGYFAATRSEDERVVKILCV